MTTASTTASTTTKDSWPTGTSPASADGIAPHRAALAAGPARRRAVADALGITVESSPDAEHVIVALASLERLASGLVRPR